VQRKRARKVTLNKACTIITSILTAVGLTFSIYGLYHWNGPANVISQESLDATDLANWYAYIWTGCPALEVRNNGHYCRVKYSYLLSIFQAQNMSTSECDEARNHTVPAPKKPSSLEVHNSGQVVARHLIPFINGSQEFEALFHETDSHCFYSSSHALEGSRGSHLSCSMLNLSLANWPTTIDPPPSIPVQARTTFQNIALVPLPPSLGARNTWSLIYWMDKSTRILSASLFVYVYVQFWRRPRFQYNPSHIRGIFETPTSRVTGLSKLGGFVEIRIIDKIHFLY